MWCKSPSSSGQAPVSGTFLSEQTSHQQPSTSIFLSEQISTSYQTNERIELCYNRLIGLLHLSRILVSSL
jgi:hypothetical protein